MKFKDKIERQRNHLTALTTVKTDTPFWIGLSTGELRNIKRLGRGELRRYFQRQTAERKAFKAHIRWLATHEGRAMLMLCRAALQEMF